MKNVIKITCSMFLLATLSIGTQGCQELKIDSQLSGNVAPNVVTDVLDKYSVSAFDVQPIVFSLNSNVPWEILSDQEWCHVSPSLSGSSSLIEDITVSVDDNPKTEERKAILTIKGMGLDEPVKIVEIIQEAKTDLMIQEFADIFATDGGTAKFKISTNKSWKLYAEKQWLSFDIYEGEAGEYEITGTATANSGTKRTSDVIIKLSDGTEKSFTATQNGLTLEFAEVEDPNMLNFSNAGETKTFNVISTIGGWEPVCKDLGVKVEKNGNDKINVTMLPNPYFKQRSVNITLEPTSAMADYDSDVLTLTQANNYAPSVSSNTTINDNGSVTLKEGNSPVIMETKKNYKYGTFTFKFSDMSIKEGSRFELKSLCANGTNLSYSIKLATNEWDNGKIQGGVRSGGSSPNNTSFWADINKFNFNTESLENTKMLKIIIEKSQIENKLKITVTVNGEVVCTDNLRPDIWVLDSSTKDFYYQFGFFSANSQSSMTIESCLFEPINYDN